MSTDATVAQLEVGGGEVLQLQHHPDPLTRKDLSSHRQ